jgi:hypothetical protein
MRLLLCLLAVSAHPPETHRHDSAHSTLANALASVAASSPVHEHTEADAEAVGRRRHDHRRSGIHPSARNEGLSAHLLSSVAIARDANVISMLLQQPTLLLESSSSARHAEAATRKFMKFSMKSARLKLYLPSLRCVVHKRERSGEVSGQNHLGAQ